MKREHIGLLDTTGIEEGNQTNIKTGYLDMHVVVYRVGKILEAYQKGEKPEREDTIFIGNKLREQKTLILSLLLDWRVNRNDIDQNVGLKKSAYQRIISQTQIKSERKIVVLELGPGDGSFLSGLQNQCGDEVECIGLGDAYYIPLETVLKPYIREDISPFYSELLEKILFPYLKKKLMKQKRESREENVDANDIFIILGAIYENESSIYSFQEMVSQIFDKEKSMYRDSKFDEHDSHDFPSPSILNWMLQHTFTDSYVGNEEKGEKWIVYKSMLEKNIQELKKLQEKGDWTEKERAWLIKEFGSYIDIFWKDVIQEKIKRGESYLQDVSQLSFTSDNRIQETDILKNIFTPAFCEEIKRPGESHVDQSPISHTAQVDLNIWPENMLGFYLGDFSRISEYPKAQVYLSSRADSHLSNQDYKTLLDMILESRDPQDPFLYFSDGVRQSYSNYYRCEQIETVMRKYCNDYEVLYTVSSYGEILGVCIVSKNHILNRQNLEGEKQTGVFFKTYEEIKKDILFQITQRIFESVMKIFGDRRDIYKSIILKQEFLRILQEKIENYRSNIQKLPGDDERIFQEFIWYFHTGNLPSVFGVSGIANIIIEQTIRETISHIIAKHSRNIDTLANKISPLLKEESFIMSHIIEKIQGIVSLDDEISFTAENIQNEFLKVIEEVIERYMREIIIDETIHIRSMREKIRNYILEGQEKPQFFIPGILDIIIEQAIYETVGVLITQSLGLK